MWLRIKRYFYERTFPISTKLTALYAAILLGILLFTSLITIFGLRFVLHVESQKELDISIINVKRYLEEGNPINSKLLEQNLLTPGLILRVFDEQGNLLLDSSPYQLEHERFIHDKEKYEGHNPHHAEKHTKSADYLEFPIKSGGQLYYLQFIRMLSFQAAFLNTLTLSLIVTNLLGLLIAILSGMFISRKILKPIRAITDTAQEIEVSNLGKRIPVSGSNDELAELANTFNHMLDRIHNGFEQQRRFVSDASHELRTPITVISGYADMLDRWGKEDRSALDEGILAIKLEAANMQNLIEKLLFLARADKGTQALKKVPLQTQGLIEEIFQETCLIAPKHQVILANNDSALILADAYAIKQMLRAFIENSIKFTKAGGRISISARQLHNNLNITIQDTGIGIPIEEQSQIFHRFYRVDKSRTKETGGTGLGLSIANWIAKQYGITLEVESALGQGTAITAQIPLLTQQ